MTASFPTSIKTFTAQVDNVSTIDAADVNQVYDEVTAIETLLQPLAATLPTHASATTGVHGVGASTVASAADISTHNSLATAHGLTAGISQALTAMRTPSTTRPALTTAAASGFDVVPYTSGSPYFTMYGDVVRHYSDNGAEVDSGFTSYSYRTKFIPGTGNGGVGIGTWEVQVPLFGLIGNNLTDPIFVITDKDDLNDMAIAVHTTSHADGTGYYGGWAAGEVRYSVGNMDSGGNNPSVPMFMTFQAINDTGTYSHFSFKPTTVANRGLFGINTRAPQYPLHIFAPAGQNNEVLLETTSAGSTTAIYFSEVATSTNISIGRPWDDTGNLTVAAGAKSWKFNSTRGNFAIVAPTVPANAGATGTVGEIAWGADYIYVCTAANTWKRAGIATW